MSTTVHTQVFRRSRRPSLPPLYAGGTGRHRRPSLPALYGPYYSAGISLPTVYVYNSTATAYIGNAVVGCLSVDL